MRKNNMQTFGGDPSFKSNDSFPPKHLEITIHDN